MSMIKIIHGGSGRARVLLLQRIQCNKYGLTKRSLLSPSSSLSLSTLGPSYDGGRRYMSDNLLGYNPMAQHNSVNQNRDDKKKKENQPSFGVDSNTAGGGVWAQTSAKRDKLAELKTEMELTDESLNKSNLDNAATPRQLLDLQLADGLRCIAALVDDGHSSSDDPIYWNEWNDYLKDLQSVSSLDALDKSQWQDHVSSLLQIVIRSRELWEQRAKDKHTQDDKDNHIHPIDDHHPLIYIRDFLPYPHPDDLPVMTKEEADIPPDVHNRLAIKSSSTGDMSALEECIAYLRLIILQKLLEEWSTNNGEDIWKGFVVNVSDSDIDRAAVQQNSGENAGNAAAVNHEQISVSDFTNVMQAYATGSCADRVEALWNLKDKDNDGLLDQEEMNLVVNASYLPIQKALPLFLNECVNVHPLDIDPLQKGDVDQPHTTGFRGWRRRRRLAKDAKILNKRMEKTLSKHLQDEVEIDHRLRCIYAWADKAHQDGKIQSVLVDDNSQPQQSPDNKGEEDDEKGFLSFGGKKRYVELQPKISYEEFLSVQKEHFPHLDRVMLEYCNSYKEELWLLQGKGRQRAELKRDSALFLLVVSLIDLAIVMS